MVLVSFSNSPRNQEATSYTSPKKKIKLPGVENLLQIHRGSQNAVYTPAGQVYNSYTPSIQNSDTSTNPHNQLRNPPHNSVNQNSENIERHLTENSSFANSFPISLQKNNINIPSAQNINLNAMNRASTIPVSSVPQASQDAYYPTETSSKNNSEYPINPSSHSYQGIPSNGNEGHNNFYQSQRQKFSNKFADSSSHRAAPANRYPTFEQKNITNLVTNPNQRQYTGPPSYASPGHNYSVVHSVSNSEARFQAIQPPLSINPNHNLPVHASHISSQNVGSFPSPNNIYSDMPQRPDRMMSFPHGQQMTTSFSQTQSMQTQMYRYSEPQNKNVQKKNIIVSMPSKQSVAWSQKDDKLLCHLKEAKKLGWRDIATYFPTRTPNACQFRWRRIVSAAKTTEGKRISPYIQKKLTKSLSKDLK